MNALLLIGGFAGCERPHVPTAAARVPARSTKATLELAAIESDAIQSLRLSLLACVERGKEAECVLARLALATALAREGYLAAAAEQLETYLAAAEQPTTTTPSSQTAESPGADRAGALLMLGEIHSQLGDLTRATATYRRAVAEYPYDAALRIGLSRALMQREHFEEAMSELARLLSDQPGEYRTVDAELAAGKDRESPGRLADIARQLVVQDPDDPAARYLHARLLFLAGERPAAGVQFLAVLQHDEAFGPAAAALAEVQAAERNWESAIERVEQALRAGLDDATLHNLKGRAHDALDQTDAAERSWLTAFKKDPRSAEPLYLLAESMERRGRRERCESLCKQILDQVDSRHPQAREKLFLIYLNSNQLAKAAELFAGYAEHGVAGPVVDRCRAMLNLATSQKPEGAQRLADYQAELGKIATNNPDDVATLVALAMSNLAKGDYEQALVQTRRALTVDPTNLRAREFQATLESKLLNFESAFRDVEDLVKERPRDLGYQQRLLELAVVRADYDRAIAILKTLQTREELAERRGIITAQLLETLLTAERLDEAVATAKQWRDQEPVDQSRQDIYLTTLTRAGRHEEAIGLVDRALTDDPTSNRLRSRYIAQLHSAKRYVEAQQQLLQWLASAPDHFELNGLLISSFWAAKQWDSAIEVARTGSELPEHHSAYQTLLAQSYLLAGRYDEAVDAYRDLLAHTQTDNAYRDLISALIRAERLTEAEQTVNKLLLPEIAKRDNGQPYDGVLVLNLRRFLSRIYQLMDRPDQAMHQLEEVHALLPSDPEANNDLGYTWADEGIRIEEAKRMVMFAASERPNESAYLDSLGWVLYKQGEFEKAVYYLRLAIKKSVAAGGTMFDHLGDALYRLGEPEDARAAWGKALMLTEPGRSPPPDDEDRRVHARVRTKLEALGRDEKPPVAPLASPGTATRPVSQASPPGDATSEDVLE